MTGLPVGAGRVWLAAPHVARLPGGGPTAAVPEHPKKQRNTWPGISSHHELTKTFSHSIGGGNIPIKRLGICWAADSVGQEIVDFKSSR